MKDPAMECFLQVRDILNTPATRLEYNRAYKKPWRFYRTHTVNEAVEALKTEVYNDLHKEV